MATDEKLGVIEDISADLRRKPDDVPTAECHRDALIKRERKLTGVD